VAPQPATVNVPLCSDASVATVSTGLLIGLASRISAQSPPGMPSYPGLRWTKFD
jgi:hypothetical protein